MLVGKYLGIRRAVWKCGHASDHITHEIMVDFIPGDIGIEKLQPDLCIQKIHVSVMFR